MCETSPCPVCADPRRDHSVICVVEEAKDVMSIERTREYRGMYHVLGGVINPVCNGTASDLNIAITGTARTASQEVILALALSIKSDVASFGLH